MGGGGAELGLRGRPLFPARRPPPALMGRGQSPETWGCMEPDTGSMLLIR